MSINERLFSLMAQRGITQQQISDAAGVSYKTVSAWKQRGSNPPAECISAIADLLGVSCRFLLTGEDETEDDIQELSVDAIDVAKVWDTLDTAGKAITKGEIYRRAETLKQGRPRRNGEVVG